jgi:hypothetical protein
MGSILSRSFAVASNKSKTVDSELRHIALLDGRTLKEKTRMSRRSIKDVRVQV